MKRCLIAAFAALFALAPINSDAVSPDKPNSYPSGGVVLEMTQPPGAVLNPGDQVGFRLQSQTDAYLIIFNIDTEGYVDLLYPARGEKPVHVRDGETYPIPENKDESLVVEGNTGVEFVFVLVVPDRDDIDRRELDFLAEAGELPPEQRYRIDGDPFIAANIIAGELVRGISHREGVSLDYTYFYINDRVAYPCYLCGECDGALEGGCNDYVVTANFDQSHPLAYPLRRGYEMIEPAAEPGLEDTAGLAEAGDERTFGRYESDDGTVNINFYPYNSEVYYETRETLTGGTDVNVYMYGYPYYYDPWYYGWYYYPSVSLGFYWGPPSFWWGFNWGWWGGYYCSAWYWPRCYSLYDYYWCNYCWYDGGYRYRPERYKDKYKAGDFTGRRSPYKEKYGTSSAFQNAYAQSIKRDSRMKLASSTLKRTSAKSQTLARETRTRGESLARGAKSIGRTTHLRTRGNASASRAKYAYTPRTRSSYAPKSRKSYGVVSPDYGKSRGTSLRPRTPRSGAYQPAHRSGTAKTSRSRSTYDRTRRSRVVPKSRSAAGTYKRQPATQRSTKGVNSGRSRSSSNRGRSAYKPPSRSNRSSAGSGRRPAASSSRSHSSRPSGRSSGRSSGSGGHARSGGKGRR
jgi:hypothetical protein